MVPTWGQLKHLTQQAEELIERGRYEATPMVMFVAMLAMLACQLRPSSTEKVHWAYLPNPPSFQPVDWMNEPIHVFVNDTHLLCRAFIYPNKVKTVVSTPFNFSGVSVYPPICFAISSSLQGAAPVLNGCVSISLQGMLTDSLRSDGKRDFWSLQLLMLGAQERLFDALKKAAPHLKDYLSCALPTPDSDEQGLKVWESISRTSGFPCWKECLYALRSPIPIVATRHFLIEWGSPYRLDQRLNLIFKEPYRSIWNDSFILYPLAIIRWHVNGWFPPLVSFGGTGLIQLELWRALAAMAPVILHRPLNEQRYIVWPCMHSPYAFLRARNWDDLGVFEGETVYNIKCVNCFISNCVYGNDYSNYKAMMIVKQPPYLMVPVKLEGQWFDDYALKVLHEFNSLIS